MSKRNNKTQSNKVDIEKAFVEDINEFDEKAFNKSLKEIAKGWKELDGNIFIPYYEEYDGLKVVVSKPKKKNDPIQGN